MNPKEKEPEIVYRIIHRATGNFQASYSRAYHDESDFNSVEHARGANCHGLFMDEKIYAIARYRVTYELLDPDVQPDNICTQCGAGPHQYCMHKK